MKYATKWLQKYQKNTLHGLDDMGLQKLNGLSFIVKVRIREGFNKKRKKLIEFS